MHGRKNTECQPYIGFLIYQKTRDCISINKWDIPKSLIGEHTNTPYQLRKSKGWKYTFKKLTNVIHCTFNLALPRLKG